MAPLNNQALIVRSHAVHGSNDQTYNHRASVLCFFSRESKVLPPPKLRFPLRNKGLIAGLIKGNQWLINPKHKAGYFLGGVALGGGS